MAKLKFLMWNVEWMNDLFTAGTGPAAFRPDGKKPRHNKDTTVKVRRDHLLSGVLKEIGPDIVGGGGRATPTGGARSRKCRTALRSIRDINMRQITSRFRSTSIRDKADASNLQSAKSKEPSNDTLRY